MIATLPDFGLIAYETVTVLTPTTTYDEHMEASVAWSEAQVPGVAVAPGATSDVTDSTRPDGTRVALTLGFPKTFTASLRGCRVSVRGKKYAVIGDPQPLTAENVPGSLNRPVEVEAVDG